jgi:very-long-chain (3R)-3-hydroxyacyl-CoA dehydratase
MVLAWSATEVIRYSFYASSLADREYLGLQYLRYTTFYVLYPLGAASEAFLIYSTLPYSSPVPGVSSWVPGAWHLTDYARALLFAIWWPGEYLFIPPLCAFSLSLSRFVRHVHIYDPNQA